MATKIAACAKRFPPKRIVVVVGAEHRHMLRDLLESESGLTCKEYWELEGDETTGNRVAATPVDDTAVSKSDSVWRNGRSKKPWLSQWSA